MNPCKRLSDCPADRLAQCRGQAVQARCDALHGLLDKADQQISDLTHAAPVPPAGDVEVFSMKYGEQPTEEDGHLVRHADHLTVVTRLTAESDALRVELCARAGQIGSLAGERDGLLAKLETADKAYKVVSDTALQLFEDSQRLKSELTKARELLARDAGVEGITRYSQLRKEIKSYLDTPIAHNVDESCGQDAEAAKGEHLCVGGGKCGIGGFCGVCPLVKGEGNGAPAASTVNGLTDDEWQDRDDRDRQELERD